MLARTLKAGGHLYVRRSARTRALADSGRGGATYTQAEAETVLAGFAFGTTLLRWSSKVAPPADRLLAAAPRASARSMWSYRTYDCVPNSHAFGVTDLLVVAALDARAGAANYRAMDAILPDLNEVLTHLDVERTFWALPRAHLGTAPPDGGTPSWWLWRHPLPAIRAPGGSPR